MAVHEHTTEPWQADDAPLLRGLRRAVRSRVSKDTRFTTYFRLLDTPVASELYLRGRGRLRHRRIQSHTRIMVEGYPSSGNTYCRQSILLSNPNLHPDQICSHTHSARVVLRAVRAGLPCLVIARDPRDAVSSAVQRFPGVSLETAFTYYAHYYRKAFTLRDQIVVAPFGAVVEDFSTLVYMITARSASISLQRQGPVSPARRFLLISIGGIASRTQARSVRHPSRDHRRAVNDRPTSCRA